jgi:hypothetical protein
MNIMDKITSKEALLQVLQNHATNPSNHGDVHRVLRLSDTGGLTSEPTIFYAMNATLSTDERENTPVFNQSLESLGHIIDKLNDEAYKDAPTDNMSYEDREIFRMQAMLTHMQEAMPESAYWVWRETARFQFGSYQAPLFIEQLRTLNKIDQSLWWHFPHISTEEPTMVAYTPSPDYGQRDRQVRTKVGRYLTQFYGGVLTENQIRSLANGVKQLQFHISKERRDFEEIYSANEDECDIGSCMQGDAYNFDSHCHPCITYAAGDFAITWLTDSVMDDRLVARAVVAFPDNPDDAHFVRVYGSEADALHDMLVERGYAKRDRYTNNPRLLCIEDNGDEDRYVLPYIDGSDRTVSMHHIDGKMYWLVGNNKGDNVQYATNTNGLSEEIGEVCGHCGDRVRGGVEDMSYSEWHDRHIGECCIDDYHYAYSRNGNQDYIHADECVYCETDSEYYHDQFLDHYDIVYCEHEGEYRQLDECVRDAGGEWLYVDNAIKVLDSSGDDTYFHETDEYQIDKVTVVTPETVDGYAYTVLVLTDDMPEAFADAYANAPRFTDDYGNERVAGFTTLHDLVRSHGNVNAGLSAFRMLTGFRVSPNRLPYATAKSLL